MADDVVYVSEAKIERREGPIRAAYLPGESEPTTYGVHGAVAEHYGVPEGAFDMHATRSTIWRPQQAVD